MMEWVTRRFKKFYDRFSHFIHTRFSCWRSGMTEYGIALVSDCMLFIAKMFYNIAENITE